MYIPIVYDPIQMTESLNGNGQNKLKMEQL